MIFIACISLSLFYFIESSAWVIKSVGRSHEVGNFVSLTNIYLYCGRLFFLVFSLTSSYIVDRSSDIDYLLRFLLISLLASLAFQLILFFAKKTIQQKVCKIMHINNEDLFRSPMKGDKRVFASTFLSTAILSFAYVLPFLAGTLFHEIRMTMASLGQFVSGIAGILLLFFLDPILYRAMDKGDLFLYMNTYLIGRIWGVAFAVIIVGLTWGWL